MACNVNSLIGISLDCGGVGGLEKVYIAKTEDVTTIGFDSTNVITGLTVNNGTLKEFSFKKGNANFVSESSIDEKASSSMVTTTLTCQFNKMDSNSRAEMQTLTKNRTYAIAKDRNGLYWFIGYGSYCVANASGASGAERTDANAFTLTITAETDELPYEVSSAAMATAIA